MKKKLRTEGGSTQFNNTVNFNTLPSIITRIPEKKNQQGNRRLDQHYKRTRPKVICRTLHSTAAFLSSAHGTFSRTEHMLGIKKISIILK